MPTYYRRQIPALAWQVEAPPVAVENCPSWIVNMLLSGHLKRNGGPGNIRLELATLTPPQCASERDWIVREGGRVFVMTPDDFRQHFEQAPEQAREA